MLAINPAIFKMFNNSIELKEDHIAAALAHELGHFDSYKKGTASRTKINESAADIKGAKYLHKAGYAPIAMSELLNIISPTFKRGAIKVLWNILMNTQLSKTDSRQLRELYQA
jgi:predicted Zn-dependent protease